MTPRMWWTGITIIALAILLHTAFPRYEWRAADRPGHLIRVDRWTGRAHIGIINDITGEWLPQ